MMTAQGFRERERERERECVQVLECWDFYVSGNKLDNTYTVNLDYVEMVEE